VAFIEALADAGLPVVEVGSFVRADRVPQMADTEAIVRRLRPRDGVTYVALVPNRRGLERARACGLGTVAVFTAATDAFAQANIGMSVETSLAVFRDVVAEAAGGRIAVRRYISTAWWCPYRLVGRETLAQVAALAVPEDLPRPTAVRGSSREPRRQRDVLLAL
jgi:hydroxymethylglutaryl-CoA lyase